MAKYRIQAKAWTSSGETIYSTEYIEAKTEIEAEAKAADHCDVVLIPQLLPRTYRKYEVELIDED